jgi:hypothetical protein
MESIGIGHVALALYAAAFLVTLAQFGWLHPRAFAEMLRDPEAFARADRRPREAPEPAGIRVPAMAAE